jgi:hypothetical protein
MSLHAFNSRLDPELWRAVHERPVAAVAPTTVLTPVDGHAPARAAHGMPADRLAMAAPLRATDWRPHRRSA